MGKAWFSGGLTWAPLLLILQSFGKTVQGLAGFSEEGMFRGWLASSQGTEVTGCPSFRSVELAFKAMV